MSTPSPDHMSYEISATVNRGSRYAVLSEDVQYGAGITLDICLPNNVLFPTYEEEEEVEDEWEVEE